MIKKTKLSVYGVLLCVVVMLSSCTVPQISVEADKKAINTLMDDFHAAAAAANKPLYLSFFSKDAVFMGTDDWERWPLPAFTDYVTMRFKGGVGWTYKAIERHINIAASGETAWLDEMTFSEKWGRFRGTAVLVKEDKAWKLAHYSMSVLVPNEAWEETMAVVKKAFQVRKKNK